MTYTFNSFIGNLWGLRRMPNPPADKCIKDAGLAGFSKMSEVLDRLFLEI